MKKLLFTLLLTSALSFAMAGTVYAAESQTSDEYSFEDRDGNSVTVSADAFAVEVMDFEHGKSWTKDKDNQDPELVLGLPDSSNAAESTGDLNLGGGGRVTVRLGEAVYDGKGNDIYIFEVGPDVEATKVEVSSDLVTWYEVGIAEGRTAGVDLSGKVPKGENFLYVRLTDCNEDANGSYPGADIDAVCGLNSKPGSRSIGGERFGATGGNFIGNSDDGETYTFEDRDGETVTVPVGAFAVEVMDFEHGKSWTKDKDNQDPDLVLGLPDSSNAAESTGDLNLGGGGRVTVRLGEAVYDGKGNDLYVFEVGPDVEATKVEVSSDLVTWYEVGIAEGRTAGVDLSGKVPKDETFQYVRLTDCNEDATGSYPGADIDAVCGLNTKPVSRSVGGERFGATGGNFIGNSDDGETYTFEDRDGETVTVPVGAFAVEVMDFEHRKSWTKDKDNQDPDLVLGLPDSSNAAESTGDLNLGGGGRVTVRLGEAVYDGKGNDIYIFEVGPDVEATKVEVSSNLTTWYEVGIAEGRTAGVDLSGQVPKGRSFQYVRLTDCNEDATGSYPGADIDAVCGLHTREIVRK
ncbi:MAG: hypothetical protein IKF45_04270 [Lachnospiraceae bacterium]|nr:hypothetical protein [Lachnospiraceae bacterium]